ncbi:MAG: SH3 domain-containing protein [Alteromonadaceae bacterium]|nr:SH3 domain-containing protein [Alteromonadaceae bacterium]
MSKSSGKDIKHRVTLEAQTRQVRAATEYAKKFAGANGLIDRVLSERIVPIQAVTAFFERSEAVKNASRIAESFAETQNSIAEQLKFNYPKTLFDQLEMVSEATRLAIFDSGVAARATGLISPLNSKALSAITIPQTELITENISRVMRDFYSEIETDYPVQAEAIKQEVEAIHFTATDPSSRNLSLEQAQSLLNTLMMAIMLFYTVVGHHNSEVESNNNKEFQDKLLNSETQMLSQMYELNSHISSVLETKHDLEKDMVEYVVLRPVNLRTKHHKGPESHVIVTLRPNQKVELLKRGEPPNKKWIYVGYQDHVEGIPRTGWVYKKYLKRI